MLHNTQTRESGAADARPVAQTYVRIVHRSRLWCIELVSPVDGAKALVSKLGGLPSRPGAIDYALQAADRMRLPLRVPAPAARP